MNLYLLTKEEKKAYLQHLFFLSENYNYKNYPQLIRHAKCWCLFYENIIEHRESRVIELCLTGE
jgi:hypothetical protein